MNIRPLSLRDGLSPSGIVVTGLKLSLPDSRFALPAPSRAWCAMCGGPFADRLCFKAGYGANFNDMSSLASIDPAHADMVCAPCLTLRSKAVLLALRAFVVNGERSWSIAKLQEKAFFILNPPDPPFVAAVATKKLQHLAWRTPPSLSRDLIYLRIGDRVVTIDRPLVLRGLEACDRLREIFADGAPGRGRRRPSICFQPFAALPFFGDANTAAGTLKRELLERSAWDSEARRLAEFLSTLGAGEIWALGVIQTTRNKNLEPTPGSEIKQPGSAPAEEKSNVQVTGSV